MQLLGEKGRKDNQKEGGWQQREGNHTLVTEFQ